MTRIISSRWVWLLAGVADFRAGTSPALVLHINKNLETHIHTNNAKSFKMTGVQVPPLVVSCYDLSATEELLFRSPDGLCYCGIGHSNKQQFLQAAYSVHLGSHSCLMCLIQCQTFSLGNLSSRSSIHLSSQFTQVLPCRLSDPNIMIITAEWWWCDGDGTELLLKVLT